MRDARLKKLRGAAPGDSATRWFVKFGTQGRFYTRKVAVSFPECLLEKQEVMLFENLKPFEPRKLS
jgi:hypothetical protein